MRTAFFLCCSLLLVCLALAEYRSIDGSNNNLNNPNWGKSNTVLISPEGTEYANGYNTPVTSRPNERILSNVFLADQRPPAPFDGFRSAEYTRVMRREGLSPDDEGRNTLSVIFGQFVGHDHSLVDVVFGGPGTLPGSSIFLPILETNDPLYQTVIDPKTGNPVVRNKLFARLARRGPDATNSSWFPFNMNTAWLDLSQIYGSNEQFYNGLRSFSQGKLKTAADGGLPFLHETTSTNECGGPNFDLLQLPSGSGDVRVDENPYLTSIHSLFFLNHNRLCDQLIADGFSADDEELFQKARALNTAVYQNIIYEEYLPVTFGKKAVRDIVGRYQGYDPNVDSRISTAYTVAANRFGHDQVNLPTYLVLDDCSLAPVNGTLGVPLQERPNCIFQTFRQVGTANTLDSAIHQRAQAMDHRVTDLLRNIIFNVGGGNTASFNMDIEAVNIFRGRECGVPNYYRLRKHHLNEDLYTFPGCTKSLNGSDPLACFLYVTSNTTAALLLQQYYLHVDNIDPFVGMLLEDPYDNKPGNMPRLVTVIVLEQFKRSRDGDRFWFQAPDAGLSYREIAEVHVTSMAKLIELNTNVRVAGDDAFSVPEQVPRRSCHHSRYD